ncbi:TlpA disulfide reductase family protein [Elizabethkingia occulta]
MSSLFYAPKILIFTCMKRFINIILIVFVLGIIFIPGVKVFLQSTLIKIGLFSPKFNNEPKEATPAAYTMQIKDEKGADISLEDLKGKVVFINFWATWCPPCIAEMPTIQTLYEKFKNDDEVEFVILEVEGNQEKARKLFSDKGLTLPVAFPNGAIPHEFYKGTLPTTVILDKKGVIVFQSEGITNYADQKMTDFIKQQKQK